MAFTQQMIQENIQGQLPVIPNNGNPAGANNMPSSAPVTPQKQPAPDPLAWLRPSEYMANVTRILQEQADRIAAPSTQQGQFNPVVRDGQVFVMPLTDDALPLSQEVPIVPLRTRQEIMQSPDAPVIPQFMNPNRALP